MTRVRVTFWALVALSVAATGVLSTALTARASRVAGLEVAGSGLVLAIAVGLAVRILLAVARRPERG